MTNAIEELVWAAREVCTEMERDSYWSAKITAVQYLANAIAAVEAQQNTAGIELPGIRQMPGASAPVEYSPASRTGLPNDCVGGMNMGDASTRKDEVTLNDEGVKPVAESSPTQPPVTTISSRNGVDVPIAKQSVTQPSDVVERVARAIMRTVFQEIDVDKADLDWRGNDVWGCDFEEMAKAAITAVEAQQNMGECRTSQRPDVEAPSSPTQTPAPSYVVERVAEAIKMRLLQENDEGDNTVEELSTGALDIHACVFPRNLARAALAAMPAGGDVVDERELEEIFLREHYTSGKTMLEVARILLSQYNITKRE